MNFNISLSKDDIEILRKIDISELGWDVRTWNILEKTKCKNLLDILNKTTLELISTEHSSKSSINEILETVTNIIQDIVLNREDSNRNNTEFKLFSEDNKTENEYIQRKNNAIKTYEVDYRIGLISTIEDLGNQLFSTYTEKELKVLHSYYGIKGVKSTLQEIGYNLNLSRQRVSEIRDKVNRLLKNSKRLKIITQCNINIFENYISDFFSADENRMSIERLRENLLETNIKTPKEESIVKWLDDALGRTWMFLGSNYYKEILELPKEIKQEKSKKMNIETKSKRASVLIRPSLQKESLKLAQKLNILSLNGKPSFNGIVERALEEFIENHSQKT